MDPDWMPPGLSDYFYEYLFPALLFVMVVASILWAARQKGDWGP
jgi:predicted permease